MRYKVRRTFSDGFIQFNHENETHAQPALIECTQRYESIYTYIHELRYALAGGSPNIE